MDECDVEGRGVASTSLGGWRTDDCRERHQRRRPSSMSKPIGDDENIIYPMMAWRAALDDDSEVCSVEILFARNQQEAQAAANGDELLGVALGMSAGQCRELGRT